MDGQAVEFATEQKQQGNGAALRILDLAWSSTVDGPGRRVVLYLRGCPLHCPWCHSPHSQSSQPHLLFFAARCIHCGRCQAACPHGVHSVTADSHHLARERCVACGACVRACPVSGESGFRGVALRLTDAEASVADIYHRLRPQLDLLGGMGGLTVSGGEPLLQAEAVARLLEQCRADGIHTAVESSGVAAIAAVERLLPLVDCWLFGLRPLPPGHPAAPLVGNPETVLRSLRRIAGHGSRIIVRLPVIPGHTDTPATWDAAAAVMADLKLAEIHLLPFNAFTPHYYDAMGLPYPLKGIAMAPSAVAEAEQFFTARGLAATVISESAQAPSFTRKEEGVP